ncbi:MAG: hypothetical protein P1U80_14130 [Pseudomonadales bacterium]|nr:hypothetical protein [Pseudomonadales bacterium]
MNLNKLLPAAFLGLLLSLGLLAGCEDDSPAENLSENVEEFGDDVEDFSDDMQGKAEEGANDARRAIDDATD